MNVPPGRTAWRRGPVVADVNDGKSGDDGARSRRADGRTEVTLGDEGRHLVGWRADEGETGEVRSVGEQRGLGPHAADVGRMPAPERRP